MAKKDFLKYRAPKDYFTYDRTALIGTIAVATAAVEGLIAAPFALEWLDGSSSGEFVAEIAGTFGLGGRVISEVALADLMAGRTARDTPADEAVVAASETYRWVSGLHGATVLSMELISGVHRRLVSNDAARPLVGSLRPKGEQVFFGSPRQRGAKGGKACVESLEALARAIRKDTRQPALVKSLALHYHLLSIHPFQDANGRTARAVETFLRKDTGLRGLHFVSMSSYYFAHRDAYEASLSASRTSGHDLTPFLEFALTGLALQCTRISDIVRRHLATALFENTMASLFGRLRTGKRQAMADRQVELLRFVLRHPGAGHPQVYAQLDQTYGALKNPWKAFLRDTRDLLEIGAIEIRGTPEPEVHPRLDWPANITEPLFIQHYRDEPRAGVILSTAV